MSKDYPEIIESEIKMTDSNQSLTIYEGEYCLKKDSIEIKVEGRVQFDWLPNSGSYFSGIVLDNISSEIDHGDYEVMIHDLKFGVGFLTMIKENFGESTEIKGRISKEAIYGDESIAVDKVVFSVVNLRDFFGLPVKKTTSKAISHMRGRLSFKTNKYDINIDKCYDYKYKKDNLDCKGGYMILYYGEIISKKGSIKLKEIQNIFHCLSSFLTFLNGRRTSALFAQGIHLGEIKWCDYTSYYVDESKDLTVYYAETFKEVKSWPTRLSIDGLDKLWTEFNGLWQDNEGKFFLTSAIHWYVEAVGNRGYSEGSIIMAQTALELIYNWWIIETKCIIRGDEADNLSASNKIRLILSQLNVSYDIPISLKYLSEYKKSDKEIIDAPGAVVQIRNTIVHSQSSKRKKLIKMSNMVMHEALQVYIWYIELALLRILKYDGSYCSRVSNNNEEGVPWI